MKKFFKKLTWFSIPFVIYLLLAALVDPFSYIKANNLIEFESKERISKRIEPHLYKMIAFENNPKNNIIIGDSRSNRFYETVSEYSDNWSALSYGGASLNEILSTFEWIIENDYKIDTLLVGLNFNLYNKYNKKMWVEETIERKSNFFSYAFSSYTARSTFLILKDFISEKKDTIGKPKVSRAKFWESSLKSYGKKFFDKYGYPEDSYERLKDMARYCKSNNVELIFWIPPCSDDINTIIDEYGLTEENQKFIEDINALGKLHNFNDNKLITSNRDNFTDPSHFNKRIGREIYQKLFKN